MKLPRYLYLVDDCYVRGSKMREIDAQEFIRRLKSDCVSNQDSKFTFFIGSGCSVSSGIPDAKGIVKQWLPKLKHVKTGNSDNLDQWVKEKFPDYVNERAAEFYGRIIEELFLTASSRQKEIENLIEGKDPSFGYAVLARLISDKDFGRHFNVVLTTNFDDLVADALYLYTNKKPLVIPHESLVGFVKVTRTLPLVIKLHGDARLAPKNTESETQKLDEAVKKVLTTLLAGTGLIFIGYGGNDKSILNILNDLPPDSLPEGVYWVGGKLPETGIREWLESRGNNARWAKHHGFDELMLLVLQEFKLEHPEKDRFERLMLTYMNTYAELAKKVDAMAEDNPEKVIFEKALRKSSSQVRDWWSIELEARRYKEKDPAKADGIYSKGLTMFPSSKELLGNYANFLTDVRKNYDEAETLYKKALEIAPNNAIILANYAIFLKDVRKNYDEAETLYKKALEIAPNDAIILGNYANFLTHVRKNYDEAETLYKKALKIAPNDAIILGNYANFLTHVRKNYDEAETLYKKALEIAPNDANTLANYAGFLLSRGRYRQGMDKLQKVLSLTSIPEKLQLECLFYEYAHVNDENLRNESLFKIKKLIKLGNRSFGWNLNDNVQKAIEDNHPQIKFLEALAEVISDEIEGSQLERFDVWRKIH